MRKPLIVRKSPSESAKVIAQVLSLSRVEPGHPALLRKRPFVINWGCSNIGAVHGDTGIINKPEAVALAINKINCALTLEMANVRTVNFCAGSYSAIRAKYPTDILLARYTVTGSSGEGIKIIRPGDPAPEQEPVIYSVYTKKTEEYRVHVAFSEAIHVVQKRKRANAEPTPDEKLVRSLGNTWVFCENDLSCDVRSDRDQLCAMAINAVAALGLDFGAVDMLYSTAGEYVVCEVNTKPGIGTTNTLAAYLSAFAEKTHG